MRGCRARLLGSALAKLEVAVATGPAARLPDACTAPAQGAPPRGHAQVPRPPNSAHPQASQAPWWQDGEEEGHGCRTGKATSNSPGARPLLFTRSRTPRCAQALLPLREPATLTRVRETSGLTEGNCSSPQRRCGPKPLRVFRSSSCLGATPSSGFLTQFPFGNRGSPLVPEAQGVAYPPLLRKEDRLTDFILIFLCSKLSRGLFWLFGLHFRQ